MNVTAVLVHFGAPSLTQTAVDTFLASDAINDVMVVLHDAYPLHRNARVCWIESENRGYAAGLNLAIQHSLERQSPRDILAINPDVTLQPQQIRDLLRSHRESEAACTFPVLSEGGELLYGYRFSKFGSLQRVTTNPEWHSGACFVITAEAWKRIRGFDETWFHYFEDHDFCVRIQKAGLKIHQAGEIVVEHAGKSNRDYPATDLPLFAVRNHLTALDRMNQLGLTVFLSVVLRHLLYLFRWKRGWRGIPKWFRGIRDFLSRAATFC